ncbi:MAG: hypothetical protein Q8Q67_01245 [bacterium]|nr:hypothetical protein [bacterium]
MFSYRFFLKQAWNITKTYRHLWFFGIFAAFIAIGGEYQILGSGMNSEPGGLFASSGFLLLYTLFNPTLYQGIAEMASGNPAAFWAIASVLALALVMTLVMVYLAIVSQAAIVMQSARAMVSKKKDLEMTISEGLVGGRRHFWKVLAINITSCVTISLSFFIISLPLVFLFFTDTTVLAIAYIILFIVFVPIALSIALIMKYAIASRVLEGTGYTASLENGWEIFRKNWLVSLEMALILFIINFAVGILTLIVLFLFFIPLFVFSLQLYAPFLTALSSMLIIVVMIVVASILNTFQISTWTSLFLHLQTKRGRSKIERLFQSK